MILPTHTQRDIRNAAMSALYGIAHQYHCDIDDVVAAIEPRRGDAPGAQTVPLDPAQSSPAGSDAVAIPAFLHPQPFEAGLPEVTASGSHSPETANEKKAQPDETLRRVEAGLVVEPSAQSTAVRTDAPHEAGDALGESLTEGAHPARDTGAGTQAPPVDTHPEPLRPFHTDALSSGAATRNGAEAAALAHNTENALAPAQAGDATSTSPAPNQEPPPPPSGVPASEPPGSDTAGGVVPPQPAPPASTTKKERVRLAHEAHPDWTIDQLADHLGLSRGSVGGHLSLLGIKLPPKTTRARRQPIAEPVQAPKPAAAPEPPPEPETPPASTAEPPRPSQALTGRSSPSVIVQKPVTKPKGTQFWLRTGNREGKYLHMSGYGLTDSKTYAWRGTEQQLLNLRQKFPDARDLIEQAIESEAAR